MVSKLQRMVPSVQTEIDRQYYYCYGDGSVEIAQTGGVIVFIIRGNSVENYIHNAYGENLSPSSLRRTDLRLQRVDVFSSQWTNAYGGFEKSQFSCIEDKN